MRLLVTGISGFVGGYLARSLLEEGHEVFGVCRGEGPSIDDGLASGDEGRFSRKHVHQGDVREPGFLRKVVETIQPDGVFHLAGIAFVPGSYRDPRRVHEVNFLGTTELLAAVREVRPDTRVLLVTSGQVYGHVRGDELPVTEEQPFRPDSPYALSKAAADLAGEEAFRTGGLDVVRVRPFAHTGPGQTPSYVCSEFARAIAAAGNGSGPARMTVGNLDAERDFSDVRDVVRAYRLLFEKGHAGEAYNVASGRTVAVRSVLDRLLEISGVGMDIETDAGKLRPAEVPRLEVSIAKIRDAAGWEPQIPLERTLDDLYAWWREQLRLVPEAMGRG